MAELVRTSLQGLKIFFFFIGDLTNSKTYGVKLKEIPQEWAIYKHSVRDRLNVNVSTLWLDIAGNHGKAVSISRLVVIGQQSGFGEKSLC